MISGAEIDGGEPFLEPAHLAPLGGDHHVALFIDETPSATGPHGCKSFMEVLRPVELWLDDHAACRIDVSPMENVDGYSGQPF